MLSGRLRSSADMSPSQFIQTILSNFLFSESQNVVEWFDRGWWLYEYGITPSIFPEYIIS
jgi:hypothetical protein